MDATHGQNERRRITEKIRDKETRRLEETRKTTAKMGGLREERSRNFRRYPRKKWIEKANSREPVSTVPHTVGGVYI